MQETFLIHLNICAFSFDNTDANENISPETREFLRDQFYKWIHKIGINAYQCPRDIAHYLIVINEELDGNSEKKVAETDLTSLEIGNSYRWSTTKKDFLIFNLRCTKLVKRKNISETKSWGSCDSNSRRKQGRR